MDILLLLASIISVIFVGYNVLYLLSFKTVKLRIPEAVAVSYGLGFGFISLEMLLFHFLKVEFSVFKILSPWLALFAVNAALYMKRRGAACEPDSVKEAPPKRGLLSLFLIGGITFEVTYAFFRALIKPIESYDAIAIYAIKSKIFFLARSIPQEYFSNLINLFPHPDYPLNIPLAKTFVYLSLGSLNDQLVKLIFPLFFVGILCVFYYAIRRFASSTYALLFTFILASIPHFNAYATNAYLEVPLAFYVFAGFLFLLRWFENHHDTGSLVLSALLTALAGWTKNEGLLYCVINITLLFVFVVLKGSKVRSKDIVHAMAYPCILLLISLPWLCIKARWHIVNDEINLMNLNPANLMKQIGKLGPIFYEFQKQLFGPKKWNILWPVLLAVFVLRYKKICKSPEGYILAAVVMALCGYVLFYMISYVDVVFFASKTWARFLLDFLPIAVYLAAIALKDDVKI